MGHKMMHDSRKAGTGWAARNLNTAVHSTSPPIREFSVQGRMVHHRGSPPIRGPTGALRFTPWRSTTRVKERRA